VNAASRLSRALGPPHEVLLRRLERLGPLSPAAVELVQGLGPAETHPAGVELQREAGAAHPRAVASGWACRQRVLSDGRRQIFGFLLPGDLTGVWSGGGLAGCSTLALTPMQTLDASRLREVLAGDHAAFAGLRVALQAAAAQEEAALLDHIVRLGRQTALERVAHQLLELHGRLGAVGLADETSFALPLTQEVMSDALGLSFVHMNRILQQLRRERLIDLKGGAVTLLQPELLISLSDYQPTQPVQ
jgi:CRP-like cAMP-binding protein